MRFGYSSRLLSEVPKSDAQAAISVWAKEFKRETGTDGSTQAAIYDDLPSLINAVVEKQVDFIALNSLDYLKIRDRVPMEPGLIGYRGGRLFDEQVLLIHRGSGIGNLRQLKGSRMNLLSGGSGEIATLWLDTILAKQGLPSAERFFESIKEVGRASKAILPVFFRQADACVVSRNAFQTMAELNPQINRELTVLAMSPALPIALACFRSTLSEAQKDEFVRIALKLVSSPSGKQILTIFKFDRIDRVPPGFLDTLVALVKEHESYQAMAKGSK
jgi:phosphonate transport system substrate-binding protein